MKSSTASSASAANSSGASAATATELIGGEGVDGLRFSELDWMPADNSGAKQKRESFHSIWHAKSPET